MNSRKIKTIFFGLLPLLLMLGEVVFSEPAEAHNASAVKGDSIKNVPKSNDKAEKRSAEISSPSGEVQEITANLLKTFRENKDKYKKDQQGYFVEVEHLLSPVVAFRLVAEGVMGKYRRELPTSDVDKFVEVFKDSLISFYGKALLKLGDEDIKINKVEDVSKKQLSDYKAGKTRSIPVSMSVKTSNRTLIISYSMIYEDNRWKLRNIIVDGINIGLQFRKQFAEAVDQYSKVSYVIEHWPEIMAGGEHKADKASKVSGADNTKKVNKQ